MARRQTECCLLLQLTCGPAAVQVTAAGAQLHDAAGLKAWADATVQTVGRMRTKQVGAGCRDVPCSISTLCRNLG